MRSATREELESVENYIETCSVKMIPVSVLENIKAEIEEVQGFVFRTEEEYEGLSMALEIINKHIQKI